MSGDAVRPRDFASFVAAKISRIGAERRLALDLLTSRAVSGVSSDASVRYQSWPLPW